MDSQRFQFRIVDLWLVTIVVALAVAAAKAGQINNTASSPILLVVLAGILGAVTGHFVSGSFRLETVSGVLLGVLGYFLSVFASSLGIRVADRTLFIVCVCAGGVIGGVMPTLLHRWGQASFRTRMCTLLMGIGLLIVPTLRWWTVSEQNRTVAKLEEAGAYVNYSDVNPLPMIFDSNRMESSPEWLRVLLGLRVVRGVTLTEKVDHRYASQLLVDKLPFVEDLQLHAEHMDDETFELLNSGTLAELDHLRFTGRRFGDKSLSRLHPLPGLVLLDLAGTSVTDASIEHIATFPQLQFLYIRETDFTAEGVKRLKSKIGRVWSPN